MRNILEAIWWALEVYLLGLFELAKWALLIVVMLILPAAVVFIFAVPPNDAYTPLVALFSAASVLAIEVIALGRWLFQRMTPTDER